MTPKLVMYLAFTWLVGQMICLFIEGTYFGVQEVSIMNSLAVFRTTEVFGLWTVPMLNLDFFTQGMPRLLMWDYSFLTGGYAIFKWFLYVLSIGAVWGLATVFLGVIQRLFAR